MDVSSVADDSEAEADHSERKLALATSLGAVESKVVGRLRFTVVLILTAMALTTSAVAFGIARLAERKNFEGDFKQIGKKIALGFQAVTKQSLSSLEGFAMDVTAYAKNSEQEWPYVALPDYHRRAGYVARQASFMSVALTAVVAEGERSNYLDFLRNETSQQEGVAIQLGIPFEEVPPIPPYPDIVKFTKNGAVPDDSPAPYLVAAQLYPSRNSTWRGNNLMAEPSRTEAIRALLQDCSYSLMPSTDFLDPEDQSHPRFKIVSENIRISKFGSNNGVTYENDPFAPVFFPVFDDLAGDENRTVVGAILGGLYWRAFLHGLLPPGANGIDVVLSSTCDQVYTYRVDGLLARFVGTGDLHDGRYDDLAGPVGVFGGLTDTLEKHGGSCQYSVQAFPSREYQNLYITAAPWYFSISLIAVFFVTSAVFLLYDYAVEKRQRVVLRSALQSGAIVTALFPDNVRDRLYEEQEIDNKVETEKPFDLEKGPKKPDQAIASSYPNCSVCFMDLAGFTKWSSTRSPEDVFVLLESAYAAFDALAGKRKVFKIETIGDCYVAVTGLPEEQPDHAVIMAKFTSQCLNAFQELVSGDIVDRLGADTRDLALRIGIHSGEVVAGVLRGQKSRFQIFGDTVNVAARCESLGRPNRIHISEATAALLKDAGKAGWFRRRDDEVEAKGKGKMQTYWVNIRVSSSKSTSSGVEL